MLFNPLFTLFNYICKFSHVFIHDLTMGQDTPPSLEFLAQHFISRKSKRAISTVKIAASTCGAKLPWQCPWKSFSEKNRFHFIHTRVNQSKEAAKAWRPLCENPHTCMSTARSIAFSYLFSRDTEGNFAYCFYF